MKVDKDQLAQVIARMKAKAESRPKTRNRPRNGPAMDLELYNKLKALRPLLISELAKRMDKTRQGIYYMVHEAGYGGTQGAKESIELFNAILKDLYKEVRDSINKAGEK